MNIVEKIKALKKEKNAVILVHNYQLPEIQEIADYTGDSLGLSMQAAKTDADMIVFCGVIFMAETAKILSPHKTVVIPDKTADCPMARMITVEQLRELKSKHPKAKVLSYVNSIAEVKAESDVCCTSANALTVARNAFTEDDEIIFVPDKFLASYTASQINRKFIFWNGHCPTHMRILPEYIEQIKQQDPDAKVIVHPECTQETINVADEVCSTGGMSKYVEKSNAKSFIIGTENGMVYRLQQDFPDRKFYPVTDLAICPNMKKTTLDKVLNSLENNEYEITLDNEIIVKAQKAIKAMLDCM